MHTNIILTTRQRKNKNNMSYLDTLGMQQHTNNIELLLKNYSNTHTMTHEDIFKEDDEEESKTVSYLNVK